MTMDRSFKLCILLTLGISIPFIFLMIPLYIRHRVFTAYHLPVSSTDSRLLNHKVSTFWCESQTIMMNTTFNAYLMSERPTFENNKRTYWTTKHFQLKSEEREYWGFYLPEKSVITLSACARYPVAQLAVYKGKRNMKRCINPEDDDTQSELENDLTDTEDPLVDTDDEGSSISSSEESFMKDCSGALFNHTFVPIQRCDNTTSWTPKDVITYNILSTDYYYFLFSSFSNMHPNTLITKFTVTKAVYNTTHAVGVCNNKTICNLPLAFGSSEFVVLEMPDIRDWIVDAGEIICEPRTIVYFPFYVCVPVTILFFAFRGIS